VMAVCWSQCRHGRPKTAAAVRMRRTRADLMPVRLEDIVIWRVVMVTAAAWTSRRVCDRVQVAIPTIVIRVR